MALGNIKGIYSPAGNSSCCLLWGILSLEALKFQRRNYNVTLSFASSTCLTRPSIFKCVDAPVHIDLYICTYIHVYRHKHLYTLKQICRDRNRHTNMHTYTHAEQYMNVHTELCNNVYTPRKRHLRTYLHWYNDTWHMVKLS